MKYFHFPKFSLFDCTGYQKAASLIRDETKMHSEGLETKKLPKKYLDTKRESKRENSAEQLNRTLIQSNREVPPRLWFIII